MSGVDGCCVGISTTEPRAALDVYRGEVKLGSSCVVLTGDTTGSNNTALGDHAGYAVIGNSNVPIGSAVASTTLTGASNNILIGTNSSVDTPTATTNNFLNIGNLIYGTNIGTASSPSNVGIGTTSVR